MMNRIFSLFIEVVFCGFQIIGNHSVVVHLKETVQLIVHVRTLQAVDEIVVQKRVIERFENAKRFLTVRLHQISAIAILIGEVVIAGKSLLANRVEEIASKGEQRVVDFKRGEDGRPKIDLLGNLIAAQRLDFLGIIEGDGDGIHAPYIAVFGLEMLAIGIIGGKDEQRVVVP